MNAVGAIRQLIIDDAATVALLSSNTAVYPVIVPQGNQYPALSVKIGDDRQGNCKGATTDVDILEIIIGVFAKTYFAAQKIDSSVRAAIDGFNGTVVTEPDNESHFFEDVSFLYRNDDYDEENKLFYRVVAYRCRYRR
jgi:hypothetical protein